MPKNPKLAQDWKNSKIRAIASSIKNFKGSNIQYAYDKKSQIYSVSASLNGKPYILTLKVGSGAMEMLLTDKEGNIVEHVYQFEDKVGFVKK